MKKQDTPPGYDQGAMLPTSVEIEQQVARFATMSRHEIDTELRRSGIDPDPAIRSIERFLDEKLGTRRRRRA